MPEEETLKCKVKEISLTVRIWMEVDRLKDAAPKWAAEVTITLSVECGTWWEGAERESWWVRLFPFCAPLPRPLPAFTRHHLPLELFPQHTDWVMSAFVSLFNSTSICFFFFYFLLSLLFLSHHFLSFSPILFLILPFSRFFPCIFSFHIPALFFLLQCLCPLLSFFTPLNIAC